MYIEVIFISHGRLSEHKDSCLLIQSSNDEAAMENRKASYGER